MYHTIEFRLEGLAEIEVPGESRVQQVVIEKGTRVQAQIKPYVVESKRRPVEVADLTLKDGTIARAVRFACFRFVDGEPKG